MSYFCFFCVKIGQFGQLSTDQNRIKLQPVNLNKNCVRWRELTKSQHILFTAVRKVEIFDLLA